MGPGRRGASKSEIERRVWDDGGAHGRRFDRFIRKRWAYRRTGLETDGPYRPVGSAAPSPRCSASRNRTRRVGRCSSTTAATPHCRSEGLERSDRLVPYGEFRLALRDRVEQRGDRHPAASGSGDWRDHDEAGKPRLVDGRERANETKDLVAAACQEIGIWELRRNVEFWIGIRNRVAHRHLPALDAAVIPQAQAGLLNLEGILGEHFGDDYLLGESLSVPLQLSDFVTPEFCLLLGLCSRPCRWTYRPISHSRQNSMRVSSTIPATCCRVTFLPTVPSSGRNPDVVAYFVKPGEVSEELGQALKEYVVLPKMIVPPRPSLIATQVVAELSRIESPTSSP